MPARRRRAELAYPAQLDAEADGGYVVTFPDFGVGATQGDSLDEALVQAADLLETMVANYMAEGWDLPAPSAPAGRPLVRLAPLVAAKAEVYRAMRAAGVSKAEHIGCRPFRLAVPHWFEHGSVSTPTGSPEAVARPRFPQNVACGFPAPTLFGSCFTALQAPAAPGRGGAV